MALHVRRSGLDLLEGSPANFARKERFGGVATSVVGVIVIGGVTVVVVVVEVEVAVM